MLGISVWCALGTCWASLCDVPWGRAGHLCVMCPGDVLGISVWCALGTCWASLCDVPWECAGHLCGLIPGNHHHCPGKEGHSYHISLFRSTEGLVRYCHHLVSIFTYFMEYSLHNNVHLKFKILDNSLFKEAVRWESFATLMVFCFKTGPA
jgi:hypothetical protein